MIKPGANKQNEKKSSEGFQNIYAFGNLIILSIKKNSFSSFHLFIYLFLKKSHKSGQE